METGISLYLSTGRLENASTIEKAVRSGATYAFTSLHIPEEEGPDCAAEARALIALCRKHGLRLVADVSPSALDKLGCTRFEELHDLGIEYLRLDFGFDARETVELSRTFHIVFNASTISEADVATWREAGADFSRFAACHNFYPKPYTGLSLADVAEMNRWLESLGFQIMGFVPGDAALRGPLHEGLPTVEAHRGHTGDRLALDMMELADAGCHVVLIGDPDVSDVVWARIRQLSDNVLDLRAELDEAYAGLYGKIQHDRPDSSTWLVRSQESRVWEDVPVPDEASPHPAAQAAQGDIVLSTKAYGRYAGELSVARRGFPLDPRDICIGHIAEDGLPFLALVRRGAGFRFVEP